jgi:hypothetical protein
MDSRSIADGFRRYKASRSASTIIGYSENSVENPF